MNFLPILFCLQTGRYWVSSFVIVIWFGIIPSFLVGRFFNKLEKYTPRSRNKQILNFNWSFSSSNLDPKSDAHCSISPFPPPTIPPLIFGNLVTFSSTRGTFKGGWKVSWIRRRMTSFKGRRRFGCWGLWKTLSLTRPQCLRWHRI